MIKISSVVEDIVQNSELISSTLADGLLNLSAYADTIHTLVEEKAKKPVKKGSIVVALSRLQQRLSTQEPIHPSVEVGDIIVRAPLVDITFDRTPSTENLLKSLHTNSYINEESFLTITEGNREITIITTESLREALVTHFGPNRPKAVISNLAAIGVSFSEAYIQTPNVMYALLRHLALKRINITEIVSTYTELTLVIRQEDVETAFHLMHQLRTSGEIILETTDRGD